MTRRILLCVGVCVAAVGGVAGVVRLAQTAPQPAVLEAALDDVRIDVVNQWLPIAEAVKQIERRFGRVVTYEDVPHVAPSDLVDFTDQITHGQPWPRRIYRPRPDSVRLAYRSRYVTLDDQAGEALTRLLAVWNGGADHSGRFRVERVAGGYHVIPIAGKGPGDTTEPYTSPLETRITIPLAERDGFETLAVLGQAITDGSGRWVHPATVPIGLLRRTQVTIGAQDQTAREVLWAALQAIDPALSWQMTCEQGVDSQCGLNVHSIGQ
jgi:hypothetical protein